MRVTSMQNPDEHPDTQKAVPVPDQTSCDAGLEPAPVVDDPARPERNWRWQLLGCLLGLLLIGAGIWVFDPAWKTETLQTRIGQQAAFQLPDGSHARLNSGTQLRVEQRLRSRQVELLAGEAIFTTEPGEPPFILRSQGVSVKTTEAMVNVRRNPDGLLISVLEGRVQVDNTYGQRHLVGGQQVQADTLSVGETRTFDPRPVEAWQQGRLLFDGLPLQEVIAELQRYYPGPLRLEVGERTRSLRISAEYDLDLGALLIMQALAEELALEYRPDPDGGITLYLGR